MRTVLITGGAKRIGAEIARAMASSGWRVIIHYRDSKDEATALKEELRARGASCEIIQANLSVQADVEALIPRCLEFGSRLHCLINNASTFKNDNIHTVTWDALSYNLNLNLIAPVLLSKAFAEQSVEGDNVIINLLDQKTVNLNPDFISYTLSKVALSGLTEMLAMAFENRIRVCGIAPGITLISGKQSQASFEKAWRATPLGRSSTPEEIARAVLTILELPSYTGQTLVLDGGESLQGRNRDVAFDLAEGE